MCEGTSMTHTCTHGHMQRKSILFLKIPPHTQLQSNKQPCNQLVSKTVKIETTGVRLFPSSVSGTESTLQTQEGWEWVLVVGSLHWRASKIMWSCPVAFSMGHSQKFRGGRPQIPRHLGLLMGSPSSAIHLRL